MAIKPSPRLAMLLLLSHAVAAVAVFLTGMPAVARLVLLAAILLSLSYYLARDALLLLPGSWREISLDEGRLSVTARNGAALSGEAGLETTVTPHFAVLCIRPEGGYFPVSRVVFPDMLGADEFRELRVRLRFAQ